MPCRPLSHAEQERLCASLPWPLLRTLFEAGAILASLSCLDVLLGTDLLRLTFAVRSVSIPSSRCRCALPPQPPPQPLRSPNPVQTCFEDWLNNHNVPFLHSEAAQSYFVAWTNPRHVSEIVFQNTEREGFCDFFMDSFVDICQCVIWFPTCVEEPRLWEPQQLRAGMTVACEVAVTDRKVHVLDESALWSDASCLLLLLLESRGVDVSQPLQLLTQVDPVLLHTWRERWAGLGAWLHHLEPEAADSLTPTRTTKRPPSRWIRVQDSKARHLRKCNEAQVFQLMLHDLRSSGAIQKTAQRMFRHRVSLMVQSTHRWQSAAAAAEHYLPLPFPCVALPASSSPQGSFSSNKKRKRTGVSAVLRPVLHPTAYWGRVFVQRCPDVVLLRVSTQHDSLDLHVTASGQVIIRCDTFSFYILDGCDFAHITKVIPHYQPAGWQRTWLLLRLGDRGFTPDLAVLICEYLGYSRMHDPSAVSWFTPSKDPQSGTIRVCVSGDLSAVSETTEAQVISAGHPLATSRSTPSGLSQCALRVSEEPNENDDDTTVRQRLSVLGWTAGEGHLVELGDLVTPHTPWVTSWGPDLLFGLLCSEQQVKLEMSTGKLSAFCGRDAGSQCVWIRYPFSLWKDGAALRLRQEKGTALYPEWEDVAVLQGPHAQWSLHLRHVSVRPDSIWLLTSAFVVLYKPKGARSQQQGWQQVWSCRVPRTWTAVQTCYQDLNGVLWLTTGQGLFSLAPSGALRLRAQGERMMTAATWHLEHAAEEKSGKVFVAICTVKEEEEGTSPPVPLREWKSHLQTEDEQHQEQNLDQSTEEDQGISD